MNDFKKMERPQEPNFATDGSPQPLVVKIYSGYQLKAAEKYAADSTKMSALGYTPISQSWAPGGYSTGDFLWALLFSLIGIGLLLLLCMLIVTPPGCLTVTYEFRQALVQKI